MRRRRLSSPDGGASASVCRRSFRRPSIAAIAAAVPNVAVEVFAFGRVPLAISARCYHARLHKLSKDNCRFVCEKDPDGLAVDTLDGEHFLAVNGVQTLSHTCANLIGDLQGAREAWRRRLPAVAAVLRHGRGRARLFATCWMADSICGGGKRTLLRSFRSAPFSNGFLHDRPGAEWIERPCPGNPV